MITRQIINTIKQLLTQVPVVTLLGPRQSGKTTLVRSCFPEFSYANLEDPKTRELAANDYEGFFAKYSEPLIIDEVQRVPELLSALQVRIDEKRTENGRFILTGSHQTKLQEGVAQSLAGRTSLITLLPLSIDEISQSAETKLPETDELILRGFMPELYRTNTRSPSVYYRDYLDTYIEKDLHQLIRVKDLNQFIKFLKLLAGRVGQVVNLSSLAGEAGISSTTLGEWISVLESSFVIVRLQPYFSNISRQIVKSPKIYFSETGLAAYLLGLENAEQVSRDPLRGLLFENLVVMDAFKTRFNRNKDANLFYLRTAKGVEIDLILKSKSSLFPFEIKSAMTATKEFSKNLKAFCTAEPSSKNPTVIYTGEEYPSFCGAAYVNYKNLNKEF
jgi:uncharacterized protein